MFIFVLVGDIEHNIRIDSNNVIIYNHCPHVERNSNNCNKFYTFINSHIPSTGGL